MSTEFNYEKAHRELAFPEWENLPDEVKALFEEVIEGYGGTHQLPDLSMPWLPGFREKFDAIPGDILNKAQSVIGPLGHWDSQKNADLQFPRSDHGAHWKFERLARQSLSGRNYTDPYIQLDTEPFYEHKPGTDYTEEEKSRIFKKQIGHLFSLVKVQACNFRLKSDPAGLSGHPFCIGRKHVERSGMILDPRVAPCDICGHEYDEHIHDMVLFLKPGREIDPDDDKVNLTQEEEDAVKALPSLLEQYGVDGVAFVR